ncbi:response regulator [Pseudomonas sp. JS3066]|uniref:response regulator n=1 Tax=unclassified Pseudomonas TaxID=196821 RepID=UPI000EA97E64|nr:MULTISPECIES: response regulator [unclassified Pseudomonas]AYF89972.1 response regulator [Pseudomonas sp. DY-1]MDH4652117.1 response regulator [Pseudomonas sp. BN606]MRK22586.1 response regulator [Pseudomonas sp. JG-B]WVK92455.1 response regulator [Pseudomonas sp. JS3066]
MSKKVLIVDDEEILAGNFQTYLEMLGCEVRTAANGAIALEVVVNFKPDLLVLDYRLPDMTGFDVFDAIRTLHSCEAVLMTAHPSIEVCNRAIERKIDIILLKPFPLHELGNVVLHGLPTGALRESPSEPSSQMERRRGGEVNFPLKLYDGAWVLSDRRRPAAGSEEPVKQVKKGT